MKVKFQVLNFLQLQQRAVIGSAEQQGVAHEKKLEFILQGLGVQDRHALLEIVEDDGQQRLYIEQMDDRARYCATYKLI